MTPLDPEHHKPDPRGPKSNPDKWYQNRVPDQIAKLTARVGQVETDRLLATLTDAAPWKVYLTIQNKLIETDPVVGKEK